MMHQGCLMVQMVQMVQMVTLRLMVKSVIKNSRLLGGEKNIKNPAYALA